MGKWMAWIVAMAMVTGSPVMAQEVSIKVIVNEGANVARGSEPAVGGVPFKKGQVKDVGSLVLLDANGKSVGAGFTKLASYNDGSVQWALVETTVLNDLPANGKKEFKVVATGPGPVAEYPITVGNTDAELTLITNAGVKVHKKAPLALDFTGSKLAESAAFTLVSADGKTYTAGPPKATIERSTKAGVTVRLDGDYLDADGKAWLGYTTRISLWTGSDLVRINHSIRNSHPTAGFNAKIKSASLAFKLPAGVKEQSAGPNWVAVGDDKSSLLMVTRHSGGCFPGGSSYSPTRPQTLYKQTAADGKAELFLVPPADTPPLAKAGAMFGYDKAGGFFALADCAHKDTEIWLDFHPNSRDAAATAVRVKALMCPLHILPDAEWISKTEALGSGHFGSLADEVDTYKLWGWKGWDNPKKRPTMAHVPDAYVATESIHGESEADNCEAFVMMYVRTGDRGYFDWARAWAEFNKAHYAYRTDGFAYQGKARKTTALEVGWYGPKEYGWSDSRSEYCHFYGRGIFDWYCLTGDVDALEGGRDLVEEVAEWSKKYKTGSAIGFYGVRGFARDWLAAIRLAQLCPDERKLADQMAEVVFKAADWDPRGFIFWGAGPEYMATHQFAAKNLPAKLKTYMDANAITMDAHGTVAKGDQKWQVRSDGGTWQQVTLGMALERYYRATGSEEAKARAIKMAEYARDWQISKKCEQAFYYTIMDFPDKGKVYDIADWDDAHKVCPLGEGPKHDGHYTRFFPDVFARAYTLTGEKAWLDLAKKAWNRGSKRGYQATKVSAPDDEVFMFATNEAPKSDTVLSTVRMFYEITHAK